MQLWSPANGAFVLAAGAQGAAGTSTWVLPLQADASLRGMPVAFRPPTASGSSRR